MANDPLTERLAQRGGVWAEYIPRLTQSTPSPEQVQALPEKENPLVAGNRFLREKLAPAGEALSSLGQKLDAGLPQEVLERYKPQAQATAIPQQAIPTEDIVIATPSMATGAAPRQAQMPSGYGTIMGSMEGQKKAIQEGAEVGMKQAAEEAAFQKTMYDESERMRQEIQAREAERQKMLDENLSTLNEKINEFNSKPATVGERFSNATTGQKIMMGIGLFLGAAPNSSGQNKALSAIQASIDSDLAKAKVDVNNANTFYSQMKEKFSDARQADAASRLAYLSNAQLKLNQIASQYKAPALQANAKLMNAKIDEEKGKLQAQFASSVNNNFAGADQLTQSIMKLPDSLRSTALKEKADLDQAQSQIKRLDDVFDNLSGLQTVDKRLGSPIQSKSLLEKGEADLFPIVKAIVGERMTDSDARMLIKPNMPKLLDNEDTRAAKKENLKNALMAKISGSTPTLSGLGLLPKKPTEKFKTLRPNK